jgi:alanine-glyoxylate transaminase/serine-glyoxylate transaminase/serine-pyruvate transaminase
MANLPDYKLMIPGPAELDDEVVAVMGQQIHAHYGPAWVQLYRETIAFMQQAFGTTADVLFLLSSGSGAMEAAVGSLFAPGEQVLIVSNGFFGERLTTITQALEIEVVLATADWGQPINPQKVREMLVQNPDIKGVLAVHHETSTGILNPIQALGDLAREFDVPLVVDAIASLGGDPLLVDEWGIDICVTAGNKCLGAPVGFAPIAVSTRAWQIMDSKVKTAVGWYLNLKTWRKYMQEWGDWHPTPVTVGSHNLQALHVALRKLHEEGLENRWRRYKETAEWFRAAMKERGFTLLVEGEQASSVITAVNRLPNMDVTEFITYLREQHNIQISGGLGELSGQIMRIGHMGHAQENIVAFLAAADNFIANQ